MFKIPRYILSLMPLNKRDDEDLRLARYYITMNFDLLDGDQGVLLSLRRRRHSSLLPQNPAIVLRDSQLRILLGTQSKSQALAPIIEIVRRM